MWTEWSTAKSQELKGSQWLPKFSKASAALTFFLRLRRNFPLCPSQNKSAGSDIPQTRYVQIKHLLLDFQQIEAHNFSILSLWAFRCPEPPAHNTFSETQDWEYMLISTALCQLPFWGIPVFYFVLYVFFTQPSLFYLPCSSGNKADPLVCAGSCITATCPSATHHAFGVNLLMLYTAVSWAALQYLSRDCSYLWPPAQNL